MDEKISSSIQVFTSILKSS